MAKFTRCSSCAGSGRMLGGGMIQRNCDNCDGSGKLSHVDDEMGYLELKQSQRFEEAKDQLKKEFPTMTDNDADKFMTEALMIQQPKKRGRPKKELVNEPTHTI